MTDSKDIVGIVKELQKEQRNGWGRSYRRKTEWLEQIKFIAPEVIDALLIAVEALEAAEYTLENNRRIGRMNAHKIIKYALSRIHAI